MAFHCYNLKGFIFYFILFTYSIIIWLLKFLNFTDSSIKAAYAISLQAILVLE